MDFYMIQFAIVFQLFVLINPLSSLPVLVEAYRKKMNVRKISIHAVLLAFFIAFFVAIIGPSLFSWFNITVDSFRIAGGVVLFLLGINTVLAKKEVPKISKVDSIISIISTPLLTGPATISYVALLTYEVGIISALVNILVAFILVGIIFFLFSYAIPKINIKIISIIAKILGLFLMAVAIQMITRGILNSIL